MLVTPPTSPKIINHKLSVHASIEMEAITDGNKNDSTRQT